MQVNNNRLEMVNMIIKLT